MHRRTAGFLVLCAVACADSADDPPVERPSDDAGPPSLVVAPPDEGALLRPDFVASPTPPQRSATVAAPPRPGRCPSGWTTVTLRDGHYCDAPPTPICPAGQFADLRGACELFGRPCAANGWPTDLPAANPVLYVDPTAPPDGDGQQATPFTSVAEALAMAEAGTVVALREGEHATAPLTIDRNVTLIGACAAQTRLHVPEVDESVPAVRLLNGGLQELTVTGDRPGIDVGDQASEQTARGLLDSVAVEGSIQAGVIVYRGAQLEARKLWIHGVRVARDNQSWGVLLGAIGGNIRVVDGVFEDAPGPGTYATDGGSIQLEATVIRRLRTRDNSSAIGSLTTYEGRTVLREVLIEDVFGVGIFGRDAGSHIDADFLAIRDLGSVVDTTAVGIGIILSSGGQARVRGGALQSLRPSAVFVSDPGSHLALTDTWLGNVNGPVVDPAALLVGEGGRATIERVWVDNEAGLTFRDPGTHGAVRDYTLRWPNTPNLAALGLKANLGATVTATAVDITGIPGVGSFAPETNMRVHKLSVHQAGGGEFAIVASEEATLEVFDAELNDAANTAIATTFGARVIGEDIVIRRPRFGLSASSSTSVHLKRMQLDQPTHIGLTADDSRLQLEDIAIDQVISPMQQGAALLLDGGSTATITRARFSQVAEDGLLILDGATAVLSDVRLSATTSRSGVNFGFYVDASRGTSAQVDRMVVDNFDLNVGIEGQAVLRDLLSTGDNTTAGLVGAGNVAVSRARFTRLTGAGVYAYGTARFQLEDVVVDTVTPNTLGLSSGIVADDDAVISADRLRVTATQAAGVLATERGSITLRDVEVTDPTLPSCVLSECGILGIAVGLYLRSAGRIDVERFDIRRAATAGILVLDDGQIAARAGTIAECGIGVLTNNPSFDAMSISDRVAFEDNDREFLDQANDFPIIELERPPLPTVDVDDDSGS